MIQWVKSPNKLWHGSAILELDSAKQNNKLKKKFFFTLKVTSKLVLKLIHHQNANIREENSYRHLPFYLTRSPGPGRAAIKE